MAGRWQGHTHLFACVLRGRPCGLSAVLNTACFVWWLAPARFAGHSMGGGTAALLTMMVREKVGAAGGPWGFGGAGWARKQGRYWCACSHPRCWPHQQSGRLASSRVVSSPLYPTSTAVRGTPAQHAQMCMCVHSHTHARAHARTHTHNPFIMPDSRVGRGAVLRHCLPGRDDPRARWGLQRRCDHAGARRRHRAHLQHRVGGRAARGGARETQIGGVGGRCCGVCDSPGWKAARLLPGSCTSRTTVAT
jgi:hypothetical protein